MENDFEEESTTMTSNYDEVSTTDQTTATQICHTGELWISVKMTFDYEEVYSDRGTGAKMDLSVWKPIPPSGYKNLGYIFTSNRSKPTFSTPVVKELREGRLCRPNGWSFHWNDRGTGAPNDGSIWSPLAPSGFRAIGSVAKHMSNADEPTNWDFDSIVCIPDEVVCKTAASNLIWKDSGSGGKFDGSVWAIHGSDFAKGGKDYGEPDCIVYRLDLNSQHIRKDF